MLPISLAAKIADAATIDVIELQSTIIVEAAFGTLATQRRDDSIAAHSMAELIALLCSFTGV